MVFYSIDFDWHYLNILIIIIALQKKKKKTQFFHVYFTNFSARSLHATIIQSGSIWTKLIWLEI